MRKNNMILEICVGVSIAIICVLLFIISNLIKKLNVYENWVVMFQTEVNQMYDRLKSVDERNLFEKDDDVGQTFQDILNIVKLFNDTVK